MQSQIYNFILLILKSLFMKQFLLYLKHFSGYKMRNFLIPVLFSMFANFAAAQTSGIYESYGILSINGGGDIYYDMQASTGNPDLNGANLGTYIYGLNTLVFKGGENKTFKNSGCNINSSAILFRVYLTGSPSGSYLNVSESFISNDGGGGNQTWRATTGSTNLIAGLSPGSYTLEVYSQAGYDSCGSGIHFSSNDGSNYKAAFTVVKAESTVLVTGSRIFTDNGSPQGPFTAIVAGSAGLVTYSYEGVGGTSYSASPTPPTNAGTYTVTATVAPDDNYNAAISPVFSFAIGAYTYIPDSNFEQELIVKGYDSTIDHFVLTSNISGVTLLNLSGKNIASLVGINDFINLKFLNCANNALTSLNISGLTNLWELVTNNNLISSLDVSLSKDLYYLDCEKNQINTLNISGLTRLQTLIVWVNKLTSIDVSNNPDLSYLDCDDNAFTSINVSGLSNLEYFYCSNNKLESINLSGLTNLIEFYCNDNLLTSMDVRGLTNLANFECTGNSTTMCILVDDVAAANTASTTIDHSQDEIDLINPENSVYYTFWKKDIGATYSYCDCSLPITWNGSAWSNGTGPISTKAAVISGVYNESANISACALTITSDAIVTIPSGFNVTLNAPLTVETGGVFTLSNNVNLIQSTNTANTGNVVVNRNSNFLYRQDYTMWSSPVASQNLLAFSPLTTLTPESRFYSYDSGADLYSSIVNPSTTVFAKGAGYLIRMPNTDPTSGYDAGTTSIAYPGVFTGVPTTGNVTLVVTNGTYNAIGNPYPSTISADAFITENAITEALYFWRKSNNVNQATAPTTSYATYTFAGGTGTSPSGGIIPNGTIQVGQGFIAKSTSTTLKFTNAMRTANNSNQILKTKAIERNRIWVNLTNSAGAFSQMMVAYMPGATQGIDAAIDGRYFNDSQTALNSLISSDEFAIQGRALPFDGTDIVPLAFKTNLAGDYTIAIDHVDGLFSGSQDVFLKDNNTGIETNLKAGAYTFTAAAGVDNARFSLKYQKTLGMNESSFNDNSVTVYKNKGTLYVNSGAVAIADIKVFDIQGRLIAEQKNVKANSAKIKDLKATQQVLIVKITSQDNKVVSKKVVN
jgi:hypothetical protein